MKKCRYFLVVIFLIFGKIQAQDTIEIIENGEWRMENVAYARSNEAEPNSPFSILHSPLEKDPTIAWLISFPAGMLGMHRVYLGTDAKTVLLYIVTAGGFLGIVPMMDWILLLRAIQNGDVSRYVGNRRFIMWL